MRNCREWQPSLSFAITLRTIPEPGHLSMIRTLAFFFLLVFFAPPVWAQTVDTSLYQITDVPVDVTADSAAHARDQAVAGAQRAALEQLLSRLGADSSLVAKLEDD